MIFFRGTQKAKYTIGYSGKIKRSTDELHVDARAFNHADKSQRWTYDARTKSIRLFHQRDFALSFKTKNLKFGGLATVRKFRNEATQKHKYREGKVIASMRAISFCLGFTVESPGAAINWQACRKHPLQEMQIVIVTIRKKMRQSNKARVAWHIDQDHMKKLKQHKNAPAKPSWGRRFFLELNMEKHRRIYVSVQKDGPDRILKIKEGVTDWRSWFVYDKRTASIRLDAHRHLALSNQDGANRLNMGKNACLRKWAATVDQEHIRLKEGDRKELVRVENTAKRCLTPHHFMNKDQNLLTWWKCSKRPSQVWKLGYKEAAPKIRGKLNKNPWVLTSMMHGKRNIYMSKQQDGKDFVIKVSKGMTDWRSLFILDPRTHSIRLHANRDLALSNQDSDAKGEDRLKQGKNVAMRKWKNQLDQILRYEDNKVTNRAKKCLTLHNYVDKEQNLVTFWKCNKHEAQKWKHHFFKNKQVEAKGTSKITGPVPKAAPIDISKLNGKEFMIRLQDGPRYAMQIDSRIKSDRSEVNVTSVPFNIMDKNQKFTWDQRTHSIRYFHNKTFALSFETEKPKYGSRAVFNLYKAKINQPKVEYNGRFQATFGVAKFCLQYVNSQPGAYAKWQACQATKAQLFTLHTVDYNRKTPIGLKITTHYKDKWEMEKNGGKVLMFRGIQGPKYTIGVVGKFRKSTDEFFVVNRAYNHKDNTQQWEYDTRTKTLRLVHKKNFVLSFKGGRISYPTYATVRGYKNEQLQQIRYENGKLQTKLRVSEFCLGATNDKPYGALQWQACRNTPHQEFEATMIVPWDTEFQQDRPRINWDWSLKGRVHLKEKRPWPKNYFPVWTPKFMIETNEKGGRRLYMSRQKDGDDIILKLKKNDNWRSWFVYDKRTKSVRFDAHRHLAISNQDGENRLNIGKNVCLRKYKNTVDQKIFMKESGKRGQYKFTNIAKRCLTPHNFVIKDNALVTFWKCNKNPTQEWKQILKVPQEKLRGKIEKNPFHLHLKMKNGRSLYMSRQKDKHDQVLKLKKGVVDWRSLFIYDKRTKSVRLHANRELALSNQDAENEQDRFKSGRTAAMRKYKHTVDQTIFLAEHKIKNTNKMCLTPRNYQNKDNNLVTFWKCNKHETQNWKWEFFGLFKQDPFQPVGKVKAYSTKIIETTKAKVGEEYVPPPPKVEKPKVVEKAVKNKVTPIGKDAQEAQAAEEKAAAAKKAASKAAKAKKSAQSLMQVARRSHRKLSKSRRHELERRRKDDEMIARELKLMHERQEKRRAEEALAATAASAPAAVPAQAAIATPQVVKMENTPSAQANVKETINNVVSKLA